MSAFRTTGVYPLNRHAIMLPTKPEPEFDPKELVPCTVLCFQFDI